MEHTGHQELEGKTRNHTRVLDGIGVLLKKSRSHVRGKITGGMSEVGGLGMRSPVGRTGGRVVVGGVMVIEGRSLAGTVGVGVVIEWRRVTEGMMCGHVVVGRGTVIEEMSLTGMIGVGVTAGMIGVGVMVDGDMMIVIEGMIGVGVTAKRNPVGRMVGVVVGEATTIMIAKKSLREMIGVVVVGVMMIVVHHAVEGSKITGGRTLPRGIETAVGLPRGIGGIKTGGIITVTRGLGILMEETNGGEGIGRDWALMTVVAGEEGSLIGLQDVGIGDVIHLHDNRKMMDLKLCVGVETWCGTLNEPFFFT